MSDVIITTREPFEIIKSAVDQTVDLIKPTYGPASNKVVISKVTHALVVDDGVQIARDLELSDPTENAILKVIREVAIKTNDLVGDGTTGALIMSQAIINEVSQLRKRDGHLIERELKKGLTEAKEQLRVKAKPVKTLEELKKVARISFDNEEIADLIANTWFKLGPKGIVTVESSPTMTTTTEMTDGISFKRGYISPYMITDPERMESIIEKPYILLTDFRLTEAADIIPVMNLLASKDVRNLVIIADNVEQSALATVVLNKVQGKFNAVAINIPPAENQQMMLEDIALLTGARVFSMAKGDKLDMVTLEDLGQAKRFISRRDSSVIIGPKGKRNDIKKAIADLSTASITAETEKERKVLTERLALFTNKIAVIKTGAATDNERKALHYKVEDAVNAVKAAYIGGIVCGAGISLANLETSSPILNAALKVPHKQLMRNMGIESMEQLKPGEALNVVTGKVGKYMDVGVIDPVDVLIAGVESAVSIASLLITTSGMIVEKPQKIKQE